MKALTVDAQSLTYLKSVRRKLHSTAEVTGKEYETQKFIFDELTSFGYKPKTVQTGLYCDCGKGNDKIAFRADIDALPIKENCAVTGCTFPAKNAMHACGHDGHTANLLNVARLCAYQKPQTPIRFIFQFGEEGIGGSLAMIDGGALDGVSEIFALHLCPELDSGKIGYCYGPMFAGCVEFDYEIKGKTSHCAFPELGADAVKAAIDVANAAYDITSKENVLFNLGKLVGGEARNVIADDCRADCTIRFFDTDKAEKIMLEIQRALLDAEKKFGVKSELISSAIYPPLINHAISVDKVRKVMSGYTVEMKERNTAEDFSNYLLKCPGCMVWLGTGKEGMRAPLHSDCFCFDEKSLLLGSELFIRLINMRMK